MLSASDPLRSSDDKAPDLLLLAIEDLGDVCSGCLSAGVWEAMKNRRNRLAFSLGPASFSMMSEDLLGVLRR